MELLLPFMPNSLKEEIQGLDLKAVIPHVVCSNAATKKCFDTQLL